MSVEFVLRATEEQVLREIVERTFDYLGKRISTGNFTRNNPDDGGVWYSAIQGGMVYSLYYHPTKRHTATADGGMFGGGLVRSIANAGEWAIAGSVAGPLGGRKTYYNVL